MTQSRALFPALSARGTSKHRMHASVALPHDAPVSTVVLALAAVLAAKKISVSVRGSKIDAARAKINSLTR